MAVGALFKIFRRRRDDELAPIDAEITAFGEALARHTLVPERHAADADLLADYARALDAYEQAKRAFVGDRDREDAADVMLALDEGRHALACVDARMAGRPLPPRRPLCFFDPRHGTSAERVSWTPEGGTARFVDVCAADAVRLADATPPITTSRHPSPSPSQKPPARPSEPRAPQRPHRGPGPFKTCPPGVRKTQQAQGTGSREIELPHREPRAPLVLVVRLHSGPRNTVELMEAGKARVLLRSRQRSRVVEPLPVSGDRHVHVRIESRAPWTAWLQPLDTVPAVHDHIASRGSFVFHYSGGPATVHMRHADRGGYSLTELTPDFERGPQVLSGRDESYTDGHLSGPTFLHVKAEGTWKIRIYANPA